MISLLFSLALVSQAASNPVSASASCIFNQGPAIPCVVVYGAQDGVVGVGFFSDVANVTFVGYPNTQNITVAALSINDRPAIPVTGSCVARNGKVGCSATAGGTTLEVIATLAQ
jgi:hypothetical protein